MRKLFSRPVTIYVSTIIGVLTAAYAAHHLALAFIPKQHLLYNDKEVPWPFLIPTIALSVGLVRMMGTRLAALGVGLISGGWSSNLIERSQSPVLDYIPLPEPFVVVANLADMALFAGAAITIWSFFIWVFNRTDLLGLTEAVVLGVVTIIALDLTSVSLMMQMMAPDAFEPTGVTSPLAVTLTVVAITLLIMGPIRHANRDGTRIISVVVMGALLAQLVEGASNTVGVYGYTLTDLLLACGAVVFMFHGYKAIRTLPDIPRETVDRPDIG